MHNVARACGVLVFRADKHRHLPLLHIKPILKSDVSGELWSVMTACVYAACCWVVRCLGSSPQLKWPQANWLLALNLKRHCYFSTFSPLFAFSSDSSTSFANLSDASSAVTVSLWHLVVAFMSYLHSASSKHQTNAHITNTCKTPRTYCQGFHARPLALPALL